jgi:serine/threonine protein kinase
VGTKEAEQSCPVCKAVLSSTARYCGGCGYAVAPTATKASDSQNIDAAFMIGKDVGGRYRIIKKLGEGGMGAVYQAEQISLKRKIALKVLKAELSASPDLVRRFNAEAELAAKLNHPNTVTLYDFGQDEDGSLFIAMELISGRSLREILVREGPQTSARIAAIGSQICSSLADAHATGIVHRDLKPDNVMLSDRGKKTDVVTVLDFGIAKLRNQEGNITQQPMTRAGDMLGTPQYMAPEQIRGDRVDARTDVYAMGILLYEMATARLPFDAKTIMSLLSKHLTEPPIPPHRRRSDITVDPTLEHLIMQCLSKAPEQRPQSMDEVEDSLAALASVSGPISGYGGAPQGQSLADPSSMRSYTPAEAHAPTALPGSAHAFTPQPAGPQAGTPIPHPVTPPQAGTPIPRANTPPQSGYGPPSQASAASTSPAQPGHSFSSSPKKSSLAGLWVVLALVLLGITGAAAYTMTAAQDDERDGDDFMDEWAGPAAPTNSQDEDSFAGVPELGSDVEEDSEMGEELEATLLAASTLYTDPTFSYQVDLPPTFEVEEASQGGAIFVGFANQVELTILTVAESVPGKFTFDETLSGLDELLEGLDLKRLSAHESEYHGHVAVHGRLTSNDDDIAGDFVLLKEGDVFYFAAIGCEADKLAKTTSFRQRFLKENFRTPGG